MRMVDKAKVLECRQCHKKLATSTKEGKGDIVIRCPKCKTVNKY